MKLNENHRPPFSYVPERLKPFLATAYYLTQIVGMIAAAVMGWKILFSNSTSSKPANSPRGLYHRLRLIAHQIPKNPRWFIKLRNQLGLLRQLQKLLC